MKTIYEYYEDFEDEKLKVKDYFMIAKKEDLKKIYNALYYVGLCNEKLENIRLELEDFVSLVNYAANIKAIGLKEEEDLVAYAELLKRIPKDISKNSRIMYKNILEEVYTKNFYEMYNLEEQVNKYLYGNPYELEASSALYIMRQKFDEYVAESLKILEEGCKEYPKSFFDSVAYVFLCKNYNPEYMLSCLPPKELVSADYEALEGQSYTTYSERLYEDYVCGDKELSKYPEVFDDYKIYKKGNRKVPFTKREFIDSIKKSECV